MTDADAPGGRPPKRMRLRYAGICHQCETAVPVGAWATYFPANKTVVCDACVPVAAAAGAGGSLKNDSSGKLSNAAPAAAGTAGASARQEYERRVAKREKRVREAHPRIGGFLLAISDEPQSTTAWQRGARGEEILAERLAPLTERGVRLLHDRRIPGTRANIDHIAMAAGGVYVIDAKRYQGRPELKVEGGIVRPKVERLIVGGRDCTKLLAGVARQVDLVSAALSGRGLDVPVRGMLCFVDADWPLFGGTFTAGGIDVLRPKEAAKRLVAAGPHGPEDIDRMHAALAVHFPPA